ncbi:TPA: hypothetical protein H1011_01345 [archaeon]|jgi:hypothetical protein|uniref:Uncharacterized protein n=1 Tax=Candidatus Undinarchaeum marinum TaxID=2756141 RepID=A0A832XL59_9ARCH|nr:hypothetical protein [Candidatus Undinarchaeum marinum]
MEIEVIQNRKKWASLMDELEPKRLKDPDEGVDFTVNKKGAVHCLFSATCLLIMMSGKKSAVAHIDTFFLRGSDRKRNIREAARIFEDLEKAFGSRRNVEIAILSGSEEIRQLVKESFPNKFTVEYCEKFPRGILSHPMKRAIADPESEKIFIFVSDQDRLGSIITKSSVWL